MDDYDEEDPLIPKDKDDEDNETTHFQPTPGESSDKQMEMQEGRGTTMNTDQEEAETSFIEGETYSRVITLQKKKHGKLFLINSQMQKQQILRPDIILKGDYR